MDNFATASDAELTLGLKRGQREAFDEIFRRYWYLLYVRVYARIKVHEESEEIVQDLFANIWQKREVLVIPDLSNYLLAAARKRVINHIRSNTVRARYREYFKNFNTFWNAAVDEVVAYEDLKKKMEAVMHRLPKKTQEVFRLNRLEGYSVSEISEYLKLPKRTIGYHLTKSLKEFRMHLKDFITVIFLSSLVP